MSDDPRPTSPIAGDRVPEPIRASGEVPHYEICVRGHLGSRWAAWFGGLSLTHRDDGTTVVRGPVVDQAALHGLLSTLRDLGVPLLSLTPVPADGAVDRSEPQPARTNRTDRTASPDRPPTQPPSHNPGATR